MVKTIYTVTSPSGQKQDFETIENDPKVYFAGSNRVAAQSLSEFEVKIETAKAKGGTVVKHANQPNQRRPGKRLSMEIIMSYTQSAYYLINGDAVTADQIRAAFDAGKARLIHGRGEGRTTTGLMLNGEDIDTRGQCYSMWDEAWTTTPETLQSALQAAYAYR